MRVNQWHKAAASNGGTNCVEVMETADGFLVRDSDPAQLAHEPNARSREMEGVVAAVLTNGFIQCACLLSNRH